MFDKSPTWQRVSGAPPKLLNVHMGHVPHVEDTSTQDRRGLKQAIAVAVALHAGLFALHFPQWLSPPETVADQKVFVLRQLKFEPPPPAQQVTVPQQKQKKKRIPIPDPTPDEPEPIEREVELPEVEFQIADLDLAVAIPEGPPQRRPGQAAPLAVGGDVTPPVKISGPQPSYTEDARKGRVQGIVILEAIIDAVGEVHDVRVLKGLPLGLTESALEAARQFRFQPATRNGAPVPVFYNLSIRFSLQ